MQDHLENVWTDRDDDAFGYETPTCEGRCAVEGAEQTEGLRLVFGMYLCAACEDEYREGRQANYDAEWGL